MMPCMTLVRVGMEPRDAFITSLVLEEGPGQGGQCSPSGWARVWDYNPSLLTFQRQESLGFWTSGACGISHISVSRGLLEQG